MGKVDAFASSFVSVKKNDFRFYFLRKNREDFEINSDFEILRLNVNNKFKSLKFKRIREKY